MYLLGLLLLLAAPDRPRPAQPRLPAGVRLLENLEYGRVGERPLLLDLYLPERIDAPLPVVIWVHGGAWRNGSKSPCPAVFLATQGYAVASVEYRLSGEARWPACILDCKQAVRWLREQAGDYRLDPGRFGAWGSSAGGHLVALLGVSGDEPALEGTGHAVSSAVQAVVDFFGPTDFRRMNEVRGAIDHDAPDSPESQLLGAPIQTVPDLCREANPLTYVSRDDPPFLIMHGDQDPLVPLAQSELLRDALAEAGVEVTFEVVEGAGHGFGGPAVTATVVEFLDRVLKGMAPVETQRPVDTRGAPGLLAPEAETPEGFAYQRFASPASGGEASCLVWLPPHYEAEPERRFPVLYWLHGAGGPASGAPHARLLAAAIEAGDAPPMILVLVNGGGQSYFADRHDGLLPVASVIRQDLIPFIDRTYRTVAERRGRGIEGIGMGGFGAGHLGFGEPSLFAGVSMVGGEALTPDPAEGELPSPLRAVFGDAARFAAATPAALAERHAQQIARRQRIRLVAAAGTAAAESTGRLHERLLQLQIPHEYVELPGAGDGPGQLYRALGADACGWWREVFGGG